MVGNAYHPSMQEREAGGLKVQEYPQLHTEFKASLREMSLSLDIRLVTTLFMCLFVCLWWRLNPEPSIYSSYHNLYQPLLVLFNRVGLSCNLLFRLARWYR